MLNGDERIELQMASKSLLSLFFLIGIEMMIVLWFVLFSAGEVPDDEVELIAGGGGTQPGYKPPNPSVPSIPNYPQYPSIPSVPVYPSYPSYPVYPSYPTYPTYPTYSTYFPFSWNYSNVFSGFSSKYTKQLR